MKEKLYYDSPAKSPQFGEEKLDKKQVDRREIQAKRRIFLRQNCL